jgi:hypothetical protein
MSDGSSRAHTLRPEALTSSFHLRCFSAAIFILAAAAVAVRSTNTRGGDETTPDTPLIKSQLVTANNPAEPALAAASQSTKETR